MPSTALATGDVAVKKEKDKGRGREEGKRRRKKEGKERRKESVKEVRKEREGKNNPLPHGAHILEHPWSLYHLFKGLPSQIQSSGSFDHFLERKHSTILYWQLTHQ